MKEINIGLIGFGTVGSGTAEVLRQQTDNLQKKTGLKLQIKKVADINVDTLPEQFSSTLLTNDVDEIFNALVDLAIFPLRIHR